MRFEHVLRVQVCGAMTSGGSESIVSAIFASIAYAKEQRNISEPEVIIGNTAHAAYWKAAKYSGARHVPHLAFHCEA